MVDPLSYAASACKPHSALFEERQEAVAVQLAVAEDPLVPTISGTAQKAQRQAIVSPCELERGTRMFTTKT
jgi:hypothetical protein